MDFLNFVQYLLLSDCRSDNFYSYRTSGPLVIVHFPKQSWESHRVGFGYFLPAQRLRHINKDNSEAEDHIKLQLTYIYIAELPPKFIIILSGSIVFEVHSVATYTQDTSNRYKHQRNGFTPETIILPF